MTNLFHTLISNPFYNGFIVLLDLLPFFDAGVIIIIFTIIVKFILLPLSIQASKSQIQMKSTEKDLRVIKEKYKDKDEQSRKIIEYYKEKNINPFAGFFILIVQLPILIGLYQVFLKSGLPEINKEVLYSFVGVPSQVNMVFLNMIDITSKSLFLAFLAGVTAYFQISLANTKQAPDSEGGVQNEIMRTMATQMKYTFPVIIGFVAYSISSAVALYLITSNIFAICQEYYIQKKYHKNVAVL